MEIIALGALEFSSIALGIKALDEMIKTAPVKVVEARTICPGKYIIVFTGDVASVEYAFHKGFETGKEMLVDKLLLPMVHPDVVLAIGKIIPTAQWESIGIIETFSVVSGIEAADRAVKVGGIRIIEIRLAIGFGGKSYVKLLGNLDAVQAAMDAGSNVAREKNMLCMATLIPQPHNETKPYFLQ